MSSKAISVTRSHSFRLTVSVFCVAVSVALSAIFHAAGANGVMFLPMHLPILLLGFLAGAKYAAGAGFVTPFLVSFIPIAGRPFGMPPIFPIATAMSLELATFGAVAGLLYWVLLGRKATEEDRLDGQRAGAKDIVMEVLLVVASLVGAMIAGRLVYGLAASILYPMASEVFGLTNPMGFPFRFGVTDWLRTVFVTGLPGIAIQLISIPTIVVILRRARIIGSGQIQGDK